MENFAACTKYESMVSIASDFNGIPHMVRWALSLASTTEKIFNG